jgi:peptide-methionine (S)-S-oxide reductase
MLKAVSESLGNWFARQQIRDIVETKHIRDAEPAALVKPTHEIHTEYDTATFGMGCFWGADCLFGAQLGVLRTRVGYADGTTKNPIYRNLGDHTEVIQIDYDPKRISYQQLLELFWNNHEYGLTTKIKKQYASLILYHSEAQRKIAEESRTEQQKIRSDEVIITEIREFRQFYPAEDYHQKYRLQQHKELTKQLGLTPRLLQTSHVAAKLNGYLVGVGGHDQFLAESKSLGLTKEQIDYVYAEAKKNEGGALYC